VHVELRHESWHDPGLASFLNDLRLGAVSADLPRMKHYLPCLTSIGGESAYLRLHGRNERGWLLNAYDARYDYLYNTRETRELRKRIESFASRCSRVIIIANNTTGGKSIPIAFQLLSHLRGNRPVPVPEASLRAFPQLRSIALSAGVEHPPLDSDLFRRAV
jgi:uncharacterized protein YecE (DUF72 family)